MTGRSLPNGPSAFLHLGTHKTGTTSIQALLAQNQKAFEEAGLYAPRSGRPQPHLAAQHNLAWELLRDPKFATGHGTLADLESEIQGRTGSLCISSEEFDDLPRFRDRLAELHDLLRRCGYVPIAIVYLRPQVDYFESLYAEIVAGGWPMRFGDYLADVLSETPTEPDRLSYDRLLDRIAAVFGREGVIVRSYEGCSPDRPALLRDFVSIVSPHVSFADLAPIERLNPRRSFKDITQAMNRSLGIRPPRRLRGASARFEPLEVDDVLRIVARYLDGNVRVYEQFGVWIPPISGARLISCVDPVMREWRRMFAVHVSANGRQNGTSS